MRKFLILFLIFMSSISYGHSVPYDERGRVIQAAVPLDVQQAQVVLLSVRSNRAHDMEFWAGFLSATQNNRVIVDPMLPFAEMVIVQGRAHTSKDRDFFMELLKQNLLEGKRTSVILDMTDMQSEEFKRQTLPLIQAATSQPLVAFSIEDAAQDGFRVVRPLEYLIELGPD